MSMSIVAPRLACEPGPGWRADAGRPYQPTVLAGPLDSIIAVRQVSSAVRRIGHQDQTLAAHNGPTHNGHRTDQGARLRVHAVR